MHECWLVQERVLGAINATAVQFSLHAHGEEPPAHPQSSNFSGKASPSAALLFEYTSEILRQRPVPERRETPLRYPQPHLFVVRSHRVTALHQRSQLDHAQINRHKGVADAVDDEHQVLHPLIEVQIQLSGTRAYI